MSQSEESPGLDEQYCYECGAIIKEAAAVCPECGVPQGGGGAGAVGGGNAGGRGQAGGQAQQGPDVRKLRKKAQSDTTTVGLVGFFLPPVAYAMLGEWKWVLIYLVTLGYLFLGFFIVPFHARGMVKNARAQLDEMGEEW